MFLHSQWSLVFVIRNANNFAFWFSSVFSASYIHDPPESSLSPSRLLFVSHNPTTYHFMLPNSSTSLLPPSSVLNVRVLWVQTCILALLLLILSASRRPCGFRREASCWDFVSGLGVGSAMCPFWSWSIQPLCFSFIVDGILAYYQRADQACCWLARRIVDGFFIRGVLPAVFWFTYLTHKDSEGELIRRLLLAWQLRHWLKKKFLKVFHGSSSTTCLLRLALRSYRQLVRDYLFG